MRFLLALLLSMIALSLPAMAQTPSDSDIPDLVERCDLPDPLPGWHWHFNEECVNHVKSTQWYRVRLIEYNACLQQANLLMDPLIAAAKAAADAAYNDWWQAVLAGEDDEVTGPLYQAWRDAERTWTNHVEFRHELYRECELNLFADAFCQCLELRIT